MKIRLVKKSDLKDFIKTQKEAFPMLNSKKQKIYFKERLKTKTGFILGDKRDYIGHIFFGRYDMIPPFTDGIFIEEFAIKKEYARRGFGKALLNAAERYCRDNKIKMIYLGTDGSKLIDYYKKSGYKIIGKLKDINPLSEYKHGQAIMAKVVR